MTPYYANADNLIAYSPTEALTETQRDMNLLFYHCSEHDFIPTTLVMTAFDFGTDNDDFPPCITEHLNLLLGPNPTDSTYQDLIDDILAFEIFCIATTN